MGSATSILPNETAKVARPSGKLCMAMDMASIMLTRLYPQASLILCLGLTCLV